MNDKGKEQYDCTHVGQFFVNYMRKIPNEICQIDAATGQEESCRSVLSRSIRLAQTFGRLGLQPGDPVALGARNHLDAHIPFYAGMMSGLPVAGIDPYLKKSELKHIFKILEPKIAFCDYSEIEEYREAVEELGLDTEIVSFGGGEMSFTRLMIAYRDLPPEDDFQVAELNADEAYCWLCSTSGSTGRPKIVALTHSHVLQKTAFFEPIKPENGERKTGLNVSNLSWISGCFNALLMPRHHVKVQTSAPTATDHVVDIINKYRPAVMVCTPSTVAPILHHEMYCDLTCYDEIKIGGSKMHNELLLSLRARVREDTVIRKGYGHTESGGIVIMTTSDKPIGNTGTLDPVCEAKLIDPDTGKEIMEPNVNGELYVRGPTMACYYRDPKATKDAYTNDGFYESGDLLYKDENGYYFFVERLKMLLKYKGYQVVPPEVEAVILRLAGVREVCVTGVPHAQDGERAVACVVRQRGAGAPLQARDVKEHVAKHLSASKHLHGGVVFLDALPTTSTGKIARQEIKKLVLTAHRE